MQEKSAIYLGAAVGVASGLMSTYPAPLGPAPSLALWTVAGLTTGIFVHGTKNLIWPGVAFGISLTVMFLFSRFGGTADKLLGYTIFIAAMSILGAAAGIVTVFLGSRLRSLLG